MHGLSPNVMYATAALACAGAGAITDVRLGRIPNWITGIGIVTGLLLHLAFDSWRALGAAAAAGIAGPGVFLLFYMAGDMNAGDVKLMAAVCCLAGLPAVAQILAGAALAGGVAALMVVFVKGRVKAMPANVGLPPTHHGTTALRPNPELNLNTPGALRLPYALAIAAGAASSACNLFVR